MELKLAEGESILVIGRTGSGKTVFLRDTIIRVFPRYIIFALDDRDMFSKICEKTVYDLTELTDTIAEGKTKIFYEYEYENEATMIKEWRLLSNIIMDRGNFALVNDEIEDVCSVQNIENEHAKILRKGRRVGVTHICATKRPASINKLIYTQSRHIFVFHISSYDIAACKQYLHLDTVEHLKPYHCLYIKDDEIIGTIKSEKKL